VKPVSIFRKEALDNQFSYGFGTVVLPRSSSISVTHFFLGAIFSFIIFVVFYFQYSSKVTATGVLVTDKGVIQVYSGAKGVIKNIYIQSGTVDKGESLFSIDRMHYSSTEPDSARERMLQIEKKLEELSTQIGKEIEKSSLLREKYFELFEQSEIRIRNQEKLVTLQKNRKSMIYEEMKSFRALSGRGFIPEKDLRDLEYKATEVQERIKGSEVELVNLRYQHGQLLLEKERFKSNSDIEISKLKIQKLDLLSNLKTLESSKDMEVRSPVSGEILSQYAKQGEFVREEIPMYSILPKDATLTARLYVSSNAIGFIKTGQPVRVSYKAFPSRNYGYFKGVIKNVGKSLISGEKIDSPIKLEGSYFVCEASIDSDHIQIGDETVVFHPGMELEASIIADTKSIASWIVTPLKEAVHSI
jgi:membrane fusion protein